MNIGEVIKQQYGGSFLRKSALSIREGAGVFEKLLGGGQYRTVLEIGTYRGVSAAAMAQYCERVITIDLKHGKLEANGDEFDRIAFWESLGVSNIYLRLVADDCEKAAFINALKFDFAFVDGAHDETVANDFALVKKCGAVLFHDYYKREGKPSYVYDFVNSLPKQEVTVLDIFAFWKSAE